MGTEKYTEIKKKETILEIGKKKKEVILSPM